MESIIKTTAINRTERISKNVSINNNVTFLSPAFWTAAEFNRFGIVPAILTVVVCLSGIAAACAAQIGMPQLIMVGVPTALFLTAIIAVAPMRYIFSLAIITTIADIIMFLL